MSDTIWDFYTECPVPITTLKLALSYSSSDSVTHTPPGGPTTTDTYMSAVSATVTFTRKRLKDAYPNGKLFGDGLTLLTADPALSNLADNEFFLVSNTRQNLDWNLILKLPTTAPIVGSRSVHIEGFGGAPDRDGTAPIHMVPSFLLTSAFHSRTVHNPIYPPPPPGIFVSGGPGGSYLYGQLFTGIGSDPTLTYSDGFFFDAGIGVFGAPLTAAPRVFTFSDITPTLASGISRSPPTQFSAPWASDFGGPYTDTISWSRTITAGGLTPVTGSGSFSWTLTAS